jgi:hypothetical protein
MQGSTQDGGGAKLAIVSAAWSVLRAWGVFLGGLTMPKHIARQSPRVDRLRHIQSAVSGQKRLLKPSISALPLIRQSTHEAALDGVDLADPKRRALELS